MALNITTPVNTSIGVTVPTSYARIGVTDGVEGNSITTNISVYASDVAYTSGADPLPVIIDGRFLLVAFSFPYNREVEGTDILQLAHDAWIGYLGTLGITAEEVLSVSL